MQQELSQINSSSNTYSLQFIQNNKKKCLIKREKLKWRIKIIKKIRLKFSLQLLKVKIFFSKLFFFSHDNGSCYGFVVKKRKFKPPFDDNKVF